MNRIDTTFERLSANGEKALITFITAGDPSLAATERLVLAMERTGADIIELGVPFSDPVAEGPVIQQASARALKNGLHTLEIFELVKRLRQKTQVPLLLMLYVNCIYVYGKKRFFADCASCGVDGVIVPDLPYEERNEILPQAKEQGVHVINLVAPTSHDRIRTIASHSGGFLYCVSSLGVTGTRDHFDTDFGTFFGAVNAAKTAPACIGFGIHSPGQVHSLKQYCDGVIVGSAVVRLVAEHGEQAEHYVEQFVKSLKDALKE